MADAVEDGADTHRKLSRSPSRAPSDGRESHALPPLHHHTRHQRALPVSSQHRRRLRDAHAPGVVSGIELSRRCRLQSTCVYVAIKMHNPVVATFNTTTCERHM